MHQNGSLKLLFGHFERYKGAADHEIELNKAPNPIVQVN